MMQGLLPPAGCGGIVGILDRLAPPMLFRIPALLTISAGQRANGVFACRGQGQDRTVDLPLFRGSITPEALTWKSPRNPAHAHKGWSVGLSLLSTTITSVPQSAVSSVGFLWGSPPACGLVGFLWGSQKALAALRIRHGLPR
jgi:hypothetical protein